MRLSYASTLSPKFNVEEFSDIGERSTNFFKIIEKDMTNANINLKNTELSDNLKSIKLRTHKVLSIYSDVSAMKK